ncbi:hypothetical protein ELI36_32515 [Rhizobium ruizarguesonis]|jgi:hypothetical protein|uniref:hypothetical protein n=1 Tax=Rhizobium ruizarguesonis TaxID=2081791 RepID=UPI00102F6935|nr:hypothetical protein [Rhizobium ruizarguesonis]TAV21270.1 hypothetical protein ELI36_32515 [Rhizobium ruizarguesonis]TAW09892.1 hypothetical protein ELI26_10180 [Rhizobium ruizarguesonis]
MKLTVLDKFSEGDALCFLCKTSLADYVDGLPENFREFYIQRGIVTNRFLDNLWDTLSAQRHIPPIVLVGGQTAPDLSPTKDFELPADFKVLDGLQRSHRLKEIWDTVAYIENEFADDLSLNVPQLTRQKAIDLRKRGINPQIFQKALGAHREGNGREFLFRRNTIWLEVWFGLSEAAQIQKMLVLNAGHKSVNIKHQIELIFWSRFEKLQAELEPGKVFREKDKSSISYSKGRQQGEYHFAHLISAFVSLLDGALVTTNAEYSADQAFPGERDPDETLLDVDDRVLRAFAHTVAALDRKLQTDEGVRWLGREVVLVGIFGAIGAVARSGSEGKVEALQDFDAKIPQFIQNLNLHGFERWRNNLELSKVNIGNVNRREVFNATLQFLKGKTQGMIQWGNIGEGAADVAS